MRLLVRHFKTAVLFAFCAVVFFAPSAAAGIIASH